MLVLLNPAAGGGRALARWQGIARDLERRWGRFDIHETRALRHTVGHIADSLRHGERRFVAVGGDGTVHLLINALATTARPAVLAQVTIGAVGLGSSNDFHKPFRNEAAARGVVPSRLEFGAATAHDIGLLLYTDADGVARRRYWANNASIGVTADGNHRFNTPDPVLKWLKRLATGPAIGYAALRALAAHRPRLMTLRSDEQPAVTVSVSNLGVVKNPHFAGSLRYDSPRQSASGQFYVHLLEGQPVPRLLSALLGLARGCFTGRDGSRSWSASRLAVEAPDPFAIEMDGEVVLARRACFALLPRCLKICP
ncbi:MAG: hypothetical protein HYV20_10245 [Gemmatimonadetes bacterium]|nr:hypothetical protein [Gemmatimonadota bacterium]